jgi:hypothetical protein
MTSILSGVVREERHAVHADGRLAAARAALDDHDARVGPRDELELARIEQRGDLGQVAVFLGRERRARAQRAAHVLGPHGLALAPRELHRAPLEPAPAALAPHEDALRGRDAQQRALVDGDRAARQHRALDLALAEGLLVLRAFLVAVVELADGRVAPVDDAHARTRVHVRGAADEHVTIRTAALAEAQVAEVGRARIHRLAHHLGATGRDARETLHLLHQRGHVLEPRRRDLVAQRDELLLVVLGGRRLGGPDRGEVRAHAPQEFFLLARDGEVLGPIGRDRLSGASLRGLVGVVR